MARGVFRCRVCDGETSLTAGTVFQDTRKPLRTWFLAMWFITSQKNGISALGLQRVLGLGSYETAWTWMHKLRRAMVRPGRDRLTGEIEVDETYVGGPEEGKRGREIEKKSIVVVAVEKNGRAIRAFITSPLSLSGGCSVRSRVVFNNSISITTLTNSRFASIAAAQVHADCFFTASHSRPFPLIRHPTAPLFMAHRRYGGEGDTHFFTGCTLNNSNYIKWLS